MAEDALAFDEVDVSYLIRGTPRPVLRGLSFRIRRGEAYGLVGESGCGKSTAAFAAVRYLPRNGAVTAGRDLVGVLRKRDERGTGMRRLGDEGVGLCLVSRAVAGGVQLQGSRADQHGARF